MKQVGIHSKQVGVGVENAADKHHMTEADRAVAKQVDVEAGLLDAECIAAVDSFDNLFVAVEDEYRKKTPDHIDFAQAHSAVFRTLSGY